MNDDRMSLAESIIKGTFPHVMCPSLETVLLDDKSLLLLPVRGRDQQQVFAPWGRLIHDVIVLGRPVVECVAPDEREVFDATVQHLAAHELVLPAERVSSEDTARFDRQVRWFAQEGVDGPAAQRRLATSTVLMLGVGGFGAATSEILARAGVGKLVLADADRVEESNLPRQLLYDDSDIGVRKSIAAVAHLDRIAPDCEAIPIDLEVTSGEDVAQLVRRYRPDLVVCAADRPPIAIKGWVDDGAFALGVPVLHGGSRPPFAYVGPMVIPGRTQCYECFFASRCAVGAEELEATVNGHRNADPTNFPAVGWGDVTAATLAAGQAIAYLAGVHDPAILGREWELDVRTLRSDWMDSLPERGDVRCDRCR